MAVNKIYGFISLVGGATGCLDSLDGDILVDSDMAIGVNSDNYRFYELVADSGAAEDVPHVITPNSNAGTKRWIERGSVFTIHGQTAGDVLYFDGDSWVRLGKDVGKYLRSNDSSVSWEAVVYDVSAPVGAHDILSTAHTDTVVNAIQYGDLLYADNTTTPVWTRLARGTANQILGMDSSAEFPEWQSHGLDTQILWNDGLVISGEADLTWTKATNTLNVTGAYAITMATDRFSVLTKTQTTATTDHTLVEGHPLSCTHKVILTYDFDGAELQEYFPTYYSRVTVSNGAITYRDTGLGTIHTGFFHDVIASENCMDCAALTHHWTAAGTDAAHRAETAAVSYWAEINTTGTAYASIIEGEHRLTKTGTYGTYPTKSSFVGIVHRYNIADAYASDMGETYWEIVVNNQGGSGYNTYRADTVYTVGGKWKTLFQGHGSVNMDISVVGIDLYTYSTWTDNVAAIKMPRNTLIDLRGDAAGQYYIRAGGTDDRVEIVAAGEYSCFFVEEGINVPGTIVNTLDTGTHNYISKTQSSLLAASDHLHSWAGHHITPVVASNLIYSVTGETLDESHRTWAPTYLSKVYIAPGAGMNSQYSSNVGLLHDVESSGKSGDLSGVFQNVYLHGQTAGDMAETAVVYYNHNIGATYVPADNTAALADSQGAYYSSVIEGQQNIENMGAGSRGCFGWWNLLWVSDAAATVLPLYHFINIVNGVDPATWAPRDHYDTFVADSVINVAGKWKNIIGARYGANMPLVITEYGIDLYNAVSWETAAPYYLTPAMIISKKATIDFRGEDAGKYYIRAGYDSDVIQVSANGESSCYFTEYGISVPGTITSTLATGEYNITTKTQTTAAADTTLCEGHPLSATNQTTLVHNFSDQSGQAYFPTYYSRVTSSAGNIAYRETGHNTIHTGFMHDVIVSTHSMDAAAVTHHFLAAGTSTAHRAETAAISYWAEFDTTGTAYASILEGEHRVTKTGTYGVYPTTSSFVGIVHRFNIADAYAATMGTTYWSIVVNNQAGSGYSTYRGNTVYTVGGKWHALFQAYGGGINMDIDNIGIDLYEYCTWTNDIPAVRLSRNTILDLRGETGGQYYIRANRTEDTVDIVVANTYSARFLSTGVTASTAILVGSSTTGGMPATGCINATNYYKNGAELTTGIASVSADPNPQLGGNLTTSTYRIIGTASGAYNVVQAIGASSSRIGAVAAYCGVSGVGGGTAIYHDGTDGYLTSDKGNLRLVAVGGNIKLKIGGTLYLLSVDGSGFVKATVTT